MSPGPGAVRALLLGAAAVLLVAALLYNEFTLAPIAREAFAPLTREKVRGVQLGFAVAGLLLLAASEAVRRSSRLARWLSGRAAEVALLLLVGLLPFAILDFGLRPFLVPKTSLFVEDSELGWRMKPHAEGEWGEVRVATNARGLRGPDVAYPKPPGVVRVLFLGDSVTFGYGIERTEDVFPFRAGRQWASALAAEVEIVDAAVGGYSPWQERIFLQREGVRYAPDLLVVGFVLNDVTEKLTLVRFGGSGRGWQLAQTAQSALDRWLSASALATWLREGFSVLRFGSDVRLGAVAEETLAVRQVSEEMEQVIEAAWGITLENLSGILDVASARRIPALIVVFPYAFQLDGDPADQTAQRRLERFASERGAPLLDLLPHFLRDEDPARLMLDDSHLSVEGHALAAGLIAEYALERGLLGPAAR